MNKKLLLSIGTLGAVVAPVAAVVACGDKEEDKKIDLSADTKEGKAEIAAIFAPTEGDTTAAAGLSDKIQSFTFEDVNGSMKSHLEKWIEFLQNNPHPDKQTSDKLWNSPRFEVKITMTVVEGQTIEYTYSETSQKTEDGGTTHDETVYKTRELVSGTKYTFVFKENGENETITLNGEKRDKFELEGVEILGKAAEHAYPRLMEQYNKLTAKAFGS